MNYVTTSQIMDSLNGTYDLTPESKRDMSSHIDEIIGNEVSFSEIMNIWKYDYNPLIKKKKI